MSETLDQAAGSLSDYTKKLEIALFYTNGDEERARQMIAGTLLDVYVIKGRFTSTSSFGAFIAFANQHYLTLNSVYAVVTDDFELKDLKTSIDWKTFERDLVDFIGAHSHDEVLARQFKTVFTSSFNINFAGQMKRLVEEQGDLDVNRLFQQMVQDRMGLQSVSMVVDVEIISSLDMEIASLTSRKAADYRSQSGGGKTEDPDIQIDNDDDSEALRGKDIRLVMNGSLILSPISGRDISLLVVGDRIRVKILDTHKRAVQVAKAFNAYDEDGIKPITGRIVSIRHRRDGGYTIFTIVAKGIYVKIEELEDNIKVGIDTSYMDAQADGGGLSKAGIAMIAGLVALLIILLAAIVLIFK